MTEISINIMPLRLRALYTLIRIVPLLCWGISSSLVGLGFAYTYNNRLGWTNYGLIILLIVLIHGVISHAFNDREDWLSGTDPLSPGVLSGGSKVIARSYYRLEDLSIIGRTALMLVLLISIYFLSKFGTSVLIFFAVGIWSAITYTCPPPAAFLSSLNRRMAMCLPCRINMYNGHLLCTNRCSIPGGGNWWRKSCPAGHGFINAPPFE